MEKNQLTNFQKTQIETIIKSCDFFEKCSPKLKPILLELQKTSQEIANNLEHKATENNKPLWHELNNIEHKLKQFTHYIETALKDTSSVAEELIEALREVKMEKEK